LPSDLFQYLAKTYSFGRAVTLTTKSHFITIPWGNPSEAKPNPKARSNQAWSMSAAEGTVAGLKLLLPILARG
jgi:hypothetical protein